jgi:hypothetical protein
MDYSFDTGHNKGANTFAHLASENPLYYKVLRKSIDKPFSKHFSDNVSTKRFSLASPEPFQKESRGIVKYFQEFFLISFIPIHILLIPFRFSISSFGISLKHLSRCLEKIAPAWAAPTPHSGRAAISRTPYWSSANYTKILNSLNAAIVTTFYIDLVDYTSVGFPVARFTGNSRAAGIPRVDVIRFALISGTKEKVGS